MKKFLAIAVVFTVLIGCYSFPKTFSLQNYFNGNYNCYTNYKVNETSINLGFCYLTKTLAKSAVGESMELINYEPNAVLSKLNAKIIKCEQLNTGTTVIYAYSSKINSSVNLGRSKVNLQLAIKDNSCIVGWPLILGSF